MTTPASHLLVGTGADPRSVTDAGWLEWLSAHIDAAWRPGEWDRSLWLFTGDLDSDRTAAWRCRTPGCPTPARGFNGRCASCRRSRSTAGVSEEEFDRAPRRRPTRPVARGGCTVPDCQGESHCRGLCFRHERAWRRAGGGPVEQFIAQARPLTRSQPCLVAGCGREHVTRRGLCHFHRNRLQRQRNSASMSQRSWPCGWPVRSPGSRPTSSRLPACPSWCASSCSTRCNAAMRHPLRWTRCRFGSSSPPERGRLGSPRRPETVCGSGGLQYNAAVTGLFADLRRHLERAWTQYAGADPYAGDVWQVQLLDLQSNGSRRWPATKGTVDFGPIELRWLREVIKDWARNTRPYLQRVRQALRACRVASQTLVACGRIDPTSLGAGDFVLVEQAIVEQRRTDGSPHSASYRTQLLRVFCEVIEHGRANALLTEVPDPFRPSQRRHRVVEDANEEQLGKALPDTVIRQLDQHLHLLGPAGRHGSISAGDLRAMHQTIYQILRDTGRRPGEIVSLKIGCVEVIDGQHNLIYDNHKAARRRRRLPITADTAEIITTWQRRREQMPTAPATRPWLFPSPLLRSRQARGHLTASCVGVAFRALDAGHPEHRQRTTGP